MPDEEETTFDISRMRFRAAPISETTDVLLFEDDLIIELEDESGDLLLEG